MNKITPSLMSKGGESSWVTPAISRGWAGVTARKNAPVFVIGCHRSGTALLYDSLLSAGGFPHFHAAPYVHTTLLKISGNPSVRRNRQKMMHFWLRSKAFRRSGLAMEDLRREIEEDCKSGGDFLRIIMGELARRAGVQRWAVYDCDNIMYMLALKREIPNALFVHVVRDGRDAALSMRKQHLVNPRLWPRKRALFAWALLWQWTVRKGRRYGQRFPSDYIEIRYEDRQPCKIRLFFLRAHLILKPNLEDIAYQPPWLLIVPPSWSIPCKTSSLVDLVFQIQESSIRFQRKMLCPHCIFRCLSPPSPLLIFFRM